MEIKEYIKMRRAQKAERDPALTVSHGSQPKFKEPYPGWPAPGMQCRCGHMAKLDLFCQDGFGNDLPPNHFRCPSCRWQWTRRKIPDCYATGGVRISIEDVAIPVL